MGHKRRKPRLGRIRKMVKPKWVDEVTSIREVRAECGLPPLEEEAGRVICLRCRQEFDSPDRIKNRVCDLCKNTEDWRNPPRNDRELYSPDPIGNRLRPQLTRRKKAS